MKLSGELDYRIRYDVEHDLFHTTLELGAIEFSKATGANILKMEIKEK